MEGASALAVALVICFLGSELAAALGFAGASISVITAVTVALATAAPRHLRSLTPSAEGLACIILQVMPSAPCCIMDSVETCSAYAEAGKVQVLQAAAMLGRY